MFFTCTLIPTRSLRVGAENENNNVNFDHWDFLRFPIKSLGDWKTAWDHIHFQGFFGTPMVMQFTWQGCDSILAAPLVLDLFRFTERAQRAGQFGVLSSLSCFFKSPMEATEHKFAAQFGMLERWARALSVATEVS